VNTFDSRASDSLGVFGPMHPLPLPFCLFEVFNCSWQVLVFSHLAIGDANAMNSAVV